MCSRSLATPDTRTFPAFAKSSTIKDVAANGCVLTPECCVGAAPLEDDCIPFETKMIDLTGAL
jgi:type I restriction enzyme M protein